MNSISNPLVNSTYQVYKELQKSYINGSPKITAIWQKELQILVLKCRTDESALAFLDIKYSLDKVGTPDIEDILAVAFHRFDAENGLNIPAALDIRKLLSVRIKERPENGNHPQKLSNILIPRPSKDDSNYFNPK